MIRYRPFLNTDTPYLVDVWRQQPLIRGLFSAVTRDLFDQQIFSKPYFENSGLILALEDSGVGSAPPLPLGFVHAGFAPNATLSDLDRTVGIVSQLKMVPGDRAAEVGRGLLEHGIQYLKQAGSTIAHVGGNFPNAPFYQGLYGGSRIPGVLDADHASRTALTEFGFQVADQVLLLERSLVGFRAQVDRDQMTLRRQFQIKAIADPLETTWWESCTFSLAERDRFTVFHKTKREYVGSVSFWDMQPLASQFGESCRGMYDLSVNAELRRGGMATFLVGEALRHLMQQGIGRVEVQVRQSDAPSLGVFKKLGFEPVAQGALMFKEL